MLNNNNEAEYGEYLKNYEVNEYIPTYVSDEDMAKIYLNDYTKMMYFNTEEAYELLDVEYKNKRFSTYNEFKNYIYSLPYTTYNVTKYYKKMKNGYLYFGIYDNNGNIFIFKTKGVMQYSVLLDDYTIEI